MNEQKNSNPSNKVDRRDMVVKAAYVIPAILAAVKATERPAYAAGSGAPVPVP
jgi:hypothetical protein